MSIENKVEELLEKNDWFKEQDKIKSQLAKPMPEDKAKALEKASAEHAEKNNPTVGDDDAEIPSIDSLLEHQVIISRLNQAKK